MPLASPTSSVAATAPFGAHAVDPSRSALVAADSAGLTPFWKSAVVESSEHGLVNTHFSTALAEMATVWVQCGVNPPSGVGWKLRLDGCVDQDLTVLCVM